MDTALKERMNLSRLIQKNEESFKFILCKTHVLRGLHILEWDPRKNQGDKYIPFHC